MVGVAENAIPDWAIVVVGYIDPNDGEIKYRFKMEGSPPYAFVVSSLEDIKHRVLHSE